MMIPVYSFYEPPAVERLREHVERALETFDENSRLVLYGNSLRESFYKILRYVIILHDFGKVPFNQAYRDKFEKERTLSFKGHEVISAWFADMYLEQVETEEGVIDRDDRGLAVLAILLHHHPLDTVRREESLSRKKDICVSADTVRLFYEELKGIIFPVRPVPLKEPVCAPDIVTEVFEGRGSIYRKYFWKIWVSGSPSIRKTFLLLTQGLIAADYSAARTRGTKAREFAETIQALLKHIGRQV